MVDPTPAAPTSEWMCRRCFNLNGHGLTAIPWNCANCGLAYGVATLLYDIPPEALGAAPDQAEGPDESRGDDVPSVTSRAEESVMDKGVFRYDTDKTRLGAPPAPWDPSHREIL